MLSPFGNSLSNPKLEGVLSKACLTEQTGLTGNLALVKHKGKSKRQKRTPRPQRPR